MKTSETIVKIATALLKAQKATGAAKKGASNPFYKSKYADLGSVMQACKEHLNENGITVLQPIMNNVVETILVHESGEWMSSETPIVCAVQNDPQKLGSSISYARRYGLQSMVFIPAEDDDGNTASTVNQKVAIQNTTHTTEQRQYWDTKEQKPVPVEGAKQPTRGVLASEKQVQLIAILLGQKGQSDEALKKKYNVSSKKELTIAQASVIIDNLNKLPNVQVEATV